MSRDHGMQYRARMLWYYSIYQEGMSMHWTKAVFSDGTFGEMKNGTVEWVKRDFAGYVFFMLNCIIAGFGAGFTWEMYSYVKPEDLAPWDVPGWYINVRKESKALGRTLAWTNKGVTVLVIKDPNGIPLPWGQLGIFGVLMSAKVMKRLAALAWRSYINDVYENVVYTRPGEYIARQAGVLSVCILPKKNALRDGVFYVRPSFMYGMIDKIVIHHKDGTVNESKTRKVRNKLRHAKRFHARLILPYIPREYLTRSQRVMLKFGALAKGDCIVAASDAALDADVVIDMNNLKPELFSLNGFAYFQAFRQEQYGKVRTNPQSLAHFYKWLFQHHIQAALIDQVNAMKAAIRRGVLPEFLDPMATTDDAGRFSDKRSKSDPDGSLNIWMDRYFKLAEDGKLLHSPHLTAALYALCRDYLHPKYRPNHKRHFPVPFAAGASITSWTVATELGYDIPVLGRGDVYLHEIGLIVSDKSYGFIVRVLGGADQDDHIDIHIRRAAHWARVPVGNGKMMTIKKDEIILILTRNPIGMQSDGRSRMGSEYVIVKPWFGAELLGVPEEEIPHVHLDKRPAMVSEVVTYGKGIFRPKGPKVPKNMREYEGFFDQQIAVASDANRAYGSHAYMMMAAMWHKIVTPFQGDEGDIVDAMQQRPCVEDVALLERCNTQVAHAIRSALLSGRVRLDPVVGDYVLGIIMHLTGDDSLKETLATLGLFDPNGPMLNLALEHQSVLNDFVKDATTHLLEIMEERRTWGNGSGVGITWFDKDRDPRGNFPILLRKVQDMEERCIKAHNDHYEANGIKKRMSRSNIPAKLWNEIGDKVVNEALAAGRTWDELTIAMREAYVYCMVGIDRSSFSGAGLASFWKMSDKRLTHGRLLDLLHDALLSFDS